MKRKILITLLMSSLILTSCGNSKFSTSEETLSNSAQFSFDGNYKSNDSEYYYTEDNTSAEATYDSSTLSDSTSLKSDKTTIEAETIQKDMLVYSCDMDIDVLEFDASIENYRKILDKYNGFIGNEYFDDGGSTSRWYDSSAQKWKSYSAMVRVPSSSYDDFCNEISNLGDLRNKRATVENVSTEYNDLSTTLQIYETKEKRYLDMLSQIKDDAQAVIVEDKLTEVQIEIAKLKTRMNQIRTDVAYSYVNISINEVKEYTEEPIKTDTFGQRLIQTIKNTCSDFLYFLEELLFLIIHLLPYAILFGGALLIFIKLIKLIKKSREKKHMKKQQNQKPEHETKTQENKDTKE